jgi:hypothetical protein
MATDRAARRSVLALVVVAFVVAGACRASGRAVPPPIASAATTTTSADVPSTTVSTLPVTTTTSASQPAVDPLTGCTGIPPRTQPRADRSRYTIAADVQSGLRSVQGTLSVRFTPDLPTDRIVFRLWPNSPLLAAAGARLDTGSVTVDGAAVTTSRPDATTLVLDRAVAAGASVTIAMPWTLATSAPISDRDTRAGDALRLGSFFPVIAWEPGHGWALEPPTTVHGETAMTPAADYDLTVTAPAGYDVLATGTRDAPGHWTAIAVPDLAVTIGHFRTATATANAPGPVAVTVAADAGVGDDPAPYAAKIAAVLEQYARRFGAYPYPSYTLAITSDLNGGIEYPMLVHTGPGAIGRSTSHEVGHQWFYALVENDQARDPWLDEALASWAEVGYEDTLASFRGRAIPAGGQGHVGEPTSFWDHTSADYYTSVYVQGVQALDAVGPRDKIDCALAAYVATNAYRIARPADLLAALDARLPGASTTMARYGVHG